MLNGGGEFGRRLEKERGVARWENESKKEAFRRAEMIVKNDTD